MTTTEEHIRALPAEELILISSNNLRALRMVYRGEIEGLRTRIDDVKSSGRIDADGRCRNLRRVLRHFEVATGNIADILTMRRTPDDMNAMIGELYRAAKHMVHTAPSGVNAKFAAATLRLQAAVDAMPEPGRERDADGPG